MSALDRNAQPHSRLNPLTREWVLVSPQRTERPWQGQVEPVAAPAERAHDPACYLCPGSTRAGGKVNPLYTGTYVFDNDFAALRPDTPGSQAQGPQSPAPEGPGTGIPPHPADTTRARSSKTQEPPGAVPCGGGTAASALTQDTASQATLSPEKTAGRPGGWSGGVTCARSPEAQGPPDAAPDGPATSVPPRTAAETCASSSSEADEHPLLVVRAEPGQCRVVCFSPRHDLTLARMEVPDIARVVDTWTGEYLELGNRPGIRSVQIFENRGAMMGCSNAHPHGQIWANRNLPNELVKEIASQADYHRAHAATMLTDYLEVELRKDERIVLKNDHFVVLVPFWAVWPFETLLVPRRPVSGLDELTPDEKPALAEILRGIAIRYDNLFQTPFPYTMGFHQRPTGGAESAGFHLHAHFYPPLLRSATVRKFMVGYEMLAMPQRDITAETAARTLRDLPGRHYLSI